MQSSNEVPAFYTRAAAAFLESEFGLRLSPVTLNKMAFEGRGPAYHKDGHRRLYPREALIEWAKARLGEAAASTAAHFTARERAASAA